MMTARTRSFLAMGLFLPLAAVLLATFACLPVPIGDPEQSKVDESLVGAYRGMPKDAGDKAAILVFVRPWDSRTYFLEYLQVDAKDGKEDRQISHFKAWLTTMGGKTFITAEPKDDMKLVLGDDGNKPFWAVLRLDKVAAGLEARMINVDSEFIKGLTKREEIEAAIKAHVSDQALYNEPIMFKKLGKEDQPFIDEVMGKFNTHK
jgi:hypothetical protein